MSATKPILIAGLGKTGLACVRYLAQSTQPLIVADSRSHPPGLADLKKQFPQVEARLGPFETGCFLNAEKIVLSPGITIHTPAVAEAMAAGVPVISEIELFAQKAQAPIVAITGSNGKTTVTTLVGEMAKQAGLNVAVGGNIGTPALALLSDPEPDLYVLELSSFQLQTTHTLAAKTAVMLNISPDHFDHHLNMTEYRQAKQRIYRHCERPIINRDAQDCYQNLTFAKTPISFGLSIPTHNDFGIRNNHLVKNDQPLIAIDQLPDQNQHHLSNCLSALALGDAVNLPMKAMMTALKNFHGLPHRCQKIAEQQQVRWYDDSKGTNIGATTAALSSISQAISGKIVLIAGGLMKGADFTQLADVIQAHVKQTILIGQDAPKIAEMLTGCSLSFAKDLDAAVSRAHATAKPGDAVVLSPACASFDMFANYIERGNAFCTAVNKILGQDPS